MLLFLSFNYLILSIIGIQITGRRMEWRGSETYKLSCVQN